MLLELSRHPFTLVNFPIRAISTISSAAFRDPYIDFPRDFSTFSAVPGADLTFINLPRSSSLLHSLDFFLDIRRPSENHSATDFNLFQSSSTSVDLTIRPVR
jgi:hypothetical protein